MKKVLSLVALAMISTIMFAVNDGAKTNQNKKEAKSGEVIVMNKEMFINDVFDYQNSKEWKYKGDKPAIIDLYADWCGPCRMTAPIMKSLAKEYDGKIVIYKVTVDKEKYIKELENLPRNQEQKDLAPIRKLLKMDLDSIYQTLEPAERRQLWRSVIKEIQIDDHKNLKVIFL